MRIAVGLDKPARPNNTVSPRVRWRGSDTHAKAMDWLSNAAL